MTDPEYAEWVFQGREYMRVYIFPAKYDCSIETSICTSPNISSQLTGIFIKTHGGAYSSYLKDGVRRCINNNNIISILGQHCLLLEKVSSAANW